MNSVIDTSLQHSKKCKSLAFASLMLITTLSAAQVEQQQPDAICPGGIPQTAEEARFVVLDEGEVLHSASNLVFMRCSIGQEWDGSTCLNEPIALDWQQALIASVESEFNGSKNWRLPNLKELSIITERSCVRPSIDDAVFPNTSPDDYWTSTPSMLDAQSAWSVTFTNASNSQRLKTRSLFVRLVRTKLVNE